MKCELSNKYDEIVQHIGFIFNEKPDAIRRALQELNSFDDLIIWLMSAQDMKISLDEALAGKEGDDVKACIYKMKREEGELNARHYYCQ